MLVGGGLNVIGALAVIFGVAPNHPDITGSWMLVQFVSGVWAGVFGANSPFLNGIVAGIPAVVLSLLFNDRVHWLLSVMAWFIVPAAALFAAALMRFMRRREP